LNNAALLTVQGIAAGIADQLLFVYSKGAGQVDFAHLHASGTALGKLKLCATSGLTSLAAGSGVAVFQYDATLTQWRLLAHEQGEFIAQPYAAGDFTCDAGMTWTVDAGDLLAFRYWLKGRTLFVALKINTATLSGSATSTLYINIPGGFIAAAPYAGICNVKDTGTDSPVGLTNFTGAGATQIKVFILQARAWTLNTNSTTVSGTFNFEVQ
jgi:hypothetical protein